MAALQVVLGFVAVLNASFAKSEDKDAAGLAALSGLFVTNNGVADIQDFISVVDLNAQPVALKKVTHVISRTDTLRVSDKTGKMLAGGYRKIDLPQARGGWASYDGRMTALNTTRPVNLLLRYLPDETYTYIVKIDEGMKSTVIPTNKKMENPVGSMEVAVKKAVDKIEIIRTLKLKKQLITPADYPAYYCLMAEWMDINGNSLLFHTIK